jgi:hypothetical protein
MTSIRKREAEQKDSWTSKAVKLWKKLTTPKKVRSPSSIMKQKKSLMATWAKKKAEKAGNLTLTPVVTGAGEEKKEVA